MHDNKNNTCTALCLAKFYALTLKQVNTDDGPLKEQNSCQELSFASNKSSRTGAVPRAASNE